MHTDTVDMVATPTITRPKSNALPTCPISYLKLKVLCLLKVSGPALLLVYVLRSHVVIELLSLYHDVSVCKLLYS